MKTSTAVAAVFAAAVALNAQPQKIESNDLPNPYRTEIAVEVIDLGTRLEKPFVCIPRASVPSVFFYDFIQRAFDGFSFRDGASSAFPSRR